MNRTAITSLRQWKANPRRKPMLLRGARQVGKTWLMKAFGAQEYLQVAYVNLEVSRNLHSVFEEGFDLRRIISAIQIETGVAVEPMSTLLILDEIQECPAALTALKYFQENAPEYHLIAAGSLLGVAMHQSVSFPVGKVEFLDLYPMSFHEFLSAGGQEPLVQAMQAGDWPLVAAFSERLTGLLKQYYFTGGMPEAVSHFIESNNYSEVREIQLRLLAAYEQDFSKHAPYQQVPRIRMVWQSITSQLARENRKFIYSALRHGARAKEFELAVAWLHDAGLIYKVTRIQKPGLPLSAHEDMNDFKLFLHDVGLLAAMGGLDPRTLLQGNALFTEFKGALTEQYALQQLKSAGLKPFYWTVEKSRAEVDFVVQVQNEVIPIEIKAEENLKSKSLRVYYDAFAPRRCLRSSMSTYRAQDWMVNIPLYGLPGLGV
ncbi:MAG: ATP-binding protein [Haliscomenobacter sp.]|nr:ATP-binding protein [Haliscomenobacter sp.]